jgi:hypothetical protein
MEFRRSTLTYLGVYVALSTAFCWPLFAQPYATGTGDWDQHLFYYASVLRNSAYGDLPFWNPWYCGGNVLWQNPQVSLVSPVYLLTLVMPLALAMKLNVLGHYVVGCLGMHLLVRRIVGVRSPVVVVYLVSLFVFSGAIALHLGAGHSDFLSMFWLPTVVYCFFRATEGRTRSLLLGGAILGFSILNGGPHVVPLAAVLLGGFGLGAMVFGRTLKPMVLAVVISVLGCVYAAPKLVPAWSFVTSADFQDRRPVKHPDFMSLDMIRHALWDQSQGTPTRLSPGVQLYGWQEYGNYMGWFGAGLALASAGWILVFRRRREHWREASAALGLVAVLLLAAGEFAAFAPANLMRSLPFFSSFRIPSRHILLVPLVGAICMAVVARVLEGVHVRGFSAWRRLIEILCVVAVCQLVLVNREQLREVFILPPDGAASRLFERPTPTNAERDVPRTGGPDRVLSTNMLGSMLAGVSPLNCWEPLQLKKAAALGPAVISGAGAISVSDSTFSPNRVAATVAVGQAPVRVVLNQNFADGWSSSIGPVERDPASGRPSVLLPAGYSGTVAFTFVPPGLWIGMTVWMLAVALSILTWRHAAPATSRAPAGRLPSARAGRERARSSS